MTKARYMVTMEGEVFGKKEISCLGRQLAQIAKDVGEHIGKVNWYVVDVDAFGSIPELLKTKAFPTKIGPESTFVDEVLKVDQFLSGVFFVTPQVEKKPRFRDTPETEDEPYEDLGDAVLEIRAFDTSFFEVYGVEEACLKFLAGKYNLNVKTLNAQ